MVDYLVRVVSVANAKAAMPQWVDAQGEWRNPTWCGVLPVDAYSDLGTPAVYDVDGITVLTPAVPPTLATGKWFIVSVDRDVTIPKAADGAIKAQGEREAGLKLPAGVVGLSTLWAGMSLI